MIRFILTTLLVAASSLTYANESIIEIEAIEMEQEDESDFENLEVFASDNIQSQTNENFGRPRLKRTTNAFAVHNKCWSDIWIAIHYRDLDNTWLTQGWFKIEAYTRKHLALTKTRYIYYTAYSQEGNYRWGNGPHSWAVRGSKKKYNFNTVNMGPIMTSYTSALTCN